MESEMLDENNEHSPEFPHIPDDFAQYSYKIKTTAKETVSFKLQSTNEMKLCQSKIGGDPYLPLTEKYPCNSEGMPLTFLMQINFSEIPQLPGYPAKGLLGFYIDASDGLLGLDLESPTNQDGFRVLYFDDIEEDESNLYKASKESESSIVDDCYSPVEKGINLSLKLCLEKQYMTPFDHRFEKSFPFSENHEIIEKYHKVFSTTGHRIGGYPCFTQTDPRMHSEKFLEYELLIQLDADNFITWGDSGVGAFFIHPDDLGKCNFSNVMYNWDCC